MSEAIDMGQLREEALEEHEHTVGELEDKIDAILSIIDEQPTRAERERAAEFLQERWTNARRDLAEKGEALIKELNEAPCIGLEDVMPYLLRVDRLMRFANEGWPLEEKPSAPVVQLVPDSDGDAK